MTVRTLIGDCRDVLPTLEAESFDCVVTSPPYWGLRDYGVEGQMGLEPTLSAYLDNMTTVCRELRRVLKPGGTFWLNIGDSYAANRGGTAQPAETLAGGKNGWMADGERVNRGRKDGYNPSRDPKGHGLKHKDLCMVPNRLAIRLQEDGWYVRSEIIWHKPTPMPESVRDRPTSAHEKVWLLTKGERYFYDADAIAEQLVKGAAGSQFHTGKTGHHQLGRASTKARRGDKQQQTADHSNPATARRMGGFNDRWDASEEAGDAPDSRNSRNVWTIASQPYKGAHFATMPPALAERCIKAGCPVGGHVLDPFAGAGTTGLVADRLGRHATLIELNPAYGELQRERINGDAPLFAEVV